MLRFHFGSIVLLVVIAALGLTLAVQYDRAAQREAALLLRLRDSLQEELSTKQAAYLDLRSTKRLPADDPKVRAAGAELKRLGSDCRETIDRLKAAQRSWVLRPWAGSGP